MQIQIRRGAVLQTVVTLIVGLSIALPAEGQTEVSTSTTSESGADPAAAADPAADAEAEAAEPENEDDDVEGITILGSRRAPRTAVDSAVPIDIVRGKDLRAQGNTDIINTLISVVPSLNANREPISNGATLIRPLNLRALPSDHTLVLVNGKRRHRGAVVGEFVTGVNRGAQGVDVYPLFGFGLRQVEILRDGAAAQYGSDAIAGVVNYQMVDDPYARMVSLQYSKTYEGDGTTLDASGVFGIPIGDDGFTTVSFQVRDQGKTVRNVQDGGAAELAAAGFDVKDPVVEWGQPNIRDDYKFLINSGFRVTEDSELYAFATYATRTVDGSFYYRNPERREGVFITDRGTSNHLFGNLDPSQGPCPVGPLPTESFDDAQAFIDAAPDHCFTFFDTFPNGFTPRFGGDVQDLSIFAGFRGTFRDAFDYDFSVGFGENAILFRILNTVNASLGPNTPFSFDLGTQTQSEVLANMDFSYDLEVGLESPVHIAFGFQYQNEEFAVTPGQPESWRAGPLAEQGFSVGSNGFQGFPDSVSGVFERDAYSVYLDVEADVTDSLLLSAAARYEEFSDFGGTFNGKAAALFRLNDYIALRGSFSTGFRAPTLGQSNVQRSSTTFREGRLAESLVISTTDPVAEFFGGGPLDPETSINVSVGTTVSAGPFSLTLDYFNIQVDDRIALLQNEVSDQDRQDLIALAVPNAATLEEVQFFVNDFDTRTQGIDIVGNYLLRWVGGNTNLTVAFNWTNTQVTNRGETVKEAREREIEDALPDYRITGTLSHVFGQVDGLIRINYYSEAFEALFNDPSLPIETPPLALVDVEVGWQFTNEIRLAVGAKNVFDTLPAEWQIPDGQGGVFTGRTAGFLGAIYPLNHPAGLTGGIYYARLTATL